MMHSKQPSKKYSFDVKYPVMGRVTIAAVNRRRIARTFIFESFGFDLLKFSLLRLWVLVLNNNHLRLSIVTGLDMSLKKLKKNIKETKPAVDTHKTILFPLDYSFKAISDFSGIEMMVVRCSDTVSRCRGITGEAEGAGRKVYWGEISLINMISCQYHSIFSHLKMKLLVKQIS